MRRQARDWEKIFAKDLSEKGLLSNIYKELLRLTLRTLRKSPDKTNWQKI
jgi:hypothetical protein